MAVLSRERRVWGVSRCSCFASLGVSASLFVFEPVAVVVAMTGGSSGKRRTGGLGKDGVRGYFGVGESAAWRASIG